MLSFFSAVAYTILKIFGEYIPPSFVPWLTKKAHVKASPIFNAHERPAAAVSRQGFSSPKIDWYDQ
jgi:hypothetical protein